MTSLIQLLMSNWRKIDYYLVFDAGKFEENVLNKPQPIKSTF